MGQDVRLLDETYSFWRDVRLLVEIGTAAADETNSRLQWTRDVRLLVEIGTAAADETNGCFIGRVVRLL